MSLHPLIGHQGARDAAGQAHLRGALPAAMLVHGSRGVGKQRFALWLAQLLVCERPDAEPCGVCASCRMAVGLEHPDIHWYFPLPRPKGATGDRLVDAIEDARVREIAELRADPLRPSHSEEVRGLYLATIRGIRSRASKRPVLGRGPVFIIGEAELLVPQEASQEAANALLKLLEEPPGGARFILTTNEPGRILPTIRSRTVPLHLGPLSEHEVSSFLETHVGLEPRKSAWVSMLSQGSPGRALGFVPDGEDPGPLEKLRRRAYELAAAAVRERSRGSYGLPLGFPPAGARTLVDLLGFVEEWLRDFAAVASGAPEAVLHRDVMEDMEARVGGGAFPPVALTRAFDAVERARELARGNVNPQLVIWGLLHDMRGALHDLEPHGASA